MRTPWLSALACLSLWAGDVQAETDNELWTSASISARVSEVVRVKTEMEARYDNNASELERLAPGAEISLRPAAWSPQLDVGAKALSERSKSGDREPTNRLYLQLEHGLELGRVEVDYRLRFQHDNELDEDEPDLRLRNRVSAKLSTQTRLSPMVSAELFTDPVAEPIEQKKVRLATGSGIKLTKQHRLKLRLQFQTALDGDDETERIVSIDYRFRFPDK